MTTSIIVGSGPAAAGVALALTADRSQRVIVVDIGNRLDADRQAVVDRMSTTPVDAWNDDDVRTIRAQPVESGRRGLPEKRSYGSDYPFEDVGQLADVRALSHANRTVVSGAYGGLSNIWGSQVMPFTPATFDRWPVTYSEMEPFYRSVLTAIPFAADDDAIAEHFPLIAESDPLPQLAPRTQAVLDAFERRRAEFERYGVVVGRARLAFEARSCVRCGLCMTGCPYGLIYSAAHTFDRLRNDGRVDYHGGLQVIDVGQVGDRPFVTARDLTDGSMHRFEADRVYLACGAVGTTRLVLDALRLYDEDVSMAESAQFVMPMLSSKPTPDPEVSTEFTLNQFNMLVALDRRWLDVSQIHFYPHNAAIADALPAALRSGPGRPVGTQVLRRLTVGLGYLPSWESPAMRIRVEPPRGPELAAGVLISGDEQPAGTNQMLRRVVRRMLRIAPGIDLWPILPMTSLSAPGKSYHFGGSLPHRTGPVDGPLTTDRLGRLSRWSRVHAVDASVFPTVPATTFTLTIMANANRIASEAMALAS
ncbi:MAG: 4Fe-4S ferredoxin [Acidimicrobiales bacterium]|jgi:choline dehydrogenase-like flavoprotein